MFKFDRPKTVHVQAKTCLTGQRDWHLPVSYSESCSDKNLGKVPFTIKWSALWFSVNTCNWTRKKKTTSLTVLYIQEYFLVQLVAPFLLFAKNKYQLPFLWPTQHGLCVESSTPLRTFLFFWSDVQKSTDNTIISRICMLSTVCVLTS